MGWTLTFTLRIPDILLAAESGRGGGEFTPISRLLGGARKDRNPDLRERVLALDSGRMSNPRTATGLVGLPRSTPGVALMNLEAFRSVISKGISRSVNNTPLEHALSTCSSTMAGRRCLVGRRKLFRLTRRNTNTAVGRIRFSHKSGRPTARYDLATIRKHPCGRIVSSRRTRGSCLKLVPSLGQSDGRDSPVTVDGGSFPK